MRNKTFEIRKAKPEELDVIYQIDEAANTLFEEVGIKFEFPEGHPFILDESQRWKNAIQNEQVYMVFNSDHQPAGFIILGKIDGQPYLDQISVHPNYMRQGLGLQLLQKAIRLSGDSPLWLTTYAHVAWNAPYYEKHGFQFVPEYLCGSEVREALRQQRLVLPFAEQRIAMIFHT